MFRPATPLRALIFGAIGAAVLTAAGCASTTTATNADAASNATSKQDPSVSQPSAAPVASVDQNSGQAEAALSTYRAMWADVVSVEQSMNDDDPTLRAHLTSSALSYFQQMIHTNRLNGYVAKGEPTLLHPVVKQLLGSGESSKALVEDCVDLSSFKLYTDGGASVASSDTGRHMTQALVIKESDGSSAVSVFVFNAAGSC